jgi:opacity protein-like surface antigen
MKHVETSTLKSVLLCAALVSAGAGTALAQVAPDGKRPTPPPIESPDSTNPTAPDPTAPMPPDQTLPPIESYPTTTSEPPLPPPETTTPVVVTPPPQETNVYVTAPVEEPMYKRYGLGISLGGGVQDFTDSDMRSTMGTAGFWDLRGVVGLNSPIAVEAAYVGSASDVDPRLGPSRSATLVGNGAEAVARLNLTTRDVVQPYLFGGVGFRHYEVTGEDFSTSATGISDSDNVLEIPVGAGLSYRYSGFLADLRFTFRGTTSEDLVIGTPDNTPVDDFLSDDDDYLPMHNWQAGARLGYEF